MSVDTQTVAVPLRPDAAQARVGAAPPVVSSYREYRPGPGGPEAVACTWHGIAGWSRRLRVLPDGRLEWSGMGSTRAPCFRFPGPARYPVRAGRQSVGIRIQPGWGAIALGAPLRCLADVTDLAELWGAMTVRDLEAALAAARTQRPGGTSSSARLRAACRPPGRRT